METSVPAAQAAAFAGAIAWFYLATNSARLITYVPQIIAVWRCRDGARSISLLTWGSWTVSHFAAILYGIVVVPDLFFVCVSLVNLLSCAVVTAIAAQRRCQLRRRSPAPGACAGAAQVVTI
jgi:uncharacterized protein with PQ loop repeat